MVQIGGGQVLLLAGTLSRRTQLGAKLSPWARSRRFKGATSTDHKANFRFNRTDGGAEKFPFGHLPLARSPIPRFLNFWISLAEKYRDSLIDPANLTNVPDSTRTICTGLCETLYTLASNARRRAYRGSTGKKKDAPRRVRNFTGMIGSWTASYFFRRAESRATTRRAVPCKQTCCARTSSLSLALSRGRAKVTWLWIAPGTNRQPVQIAPRRLILHRI